MKQQLKAGLLVGKDVLKNAVESIVVVPEAGATIALIGLQQGLKYKGSMKTGLKGAGMAAGAFVAWGAATTLVTQFDTAKQRYEGYLREAN